MGKTPRAKKPKAPPPAKRRWRDVLAGWFEGVTPARYAGIVASAVLMIVMFPSADLGFLAWVAIVPLLLAVDGLPARAWGSGAFLSFLVAKAGTIYWLVYTMHHYGYINVVASVAIYLLLVTILALLWGLTFAGAHALAHRGGAPLFLALPVAWVTNEWVQTWLLTGFPWMLLGYAPYRWRTLIQAADLLGVWGIAFLIVLANVAAFEVARFLLKRRERFPVAAAATAAALMIGALVYGHLRLRQVEAAMAAETPMKVAVLQGNVDQTEKWRDAKVRARTPRMYLDMAVEANRNRDLALILLPETAIPVWQDRDDPVLEPRIARLGTETGTYVLTGCPTKGREGGDKRINYNSAVLVSPEGKALGWYHKNRLVPFGEYIPLKDFLEKILGGLVAGTGNFRAWGRFSLLEIPQGPLGVMICYETIYPGVVRSIVNQGATFLATITNDAWFGNTSAPRQHLAMVAARAIENRMYVPRAANTGISGIVDPTGRILHQTPVYVPASYAGEIRPMRLTTLYRRVGDVLAYACVALSLGLGARVAVRARRAAPNRRKP